MFLSRERLRQIILEVISEQSVPMRMRGQGDREAFASGVFEEKEGGSEIEEQELPLGYGASAQRKKRRIAGIEGDESAFGE